nr:cutinase family protein [Mycolicibacterium sediminis]
MASADDCPDAEVIFARGTDEPDGMGVVGDALVGSLRQQAGSLNIRTYPVDYSAGKLQLDGRGGAKDVVSRVESTASACPDTKIVLGGYSQGATVIDLVAGVPVGGVPLGLGKSLAAEYADNVAAVVTFGNVIGRGGDSVATRSALLGSKAMDFCNPGDPICHAGPGNSWSGHTDGYVPGYTDQAAAFVAAKLLTGYEDAYPGYGPALPGYGLQPGYGYGPQTEHGMPPGPQPVVDPSAQRSEHMPPGYVSDTQASDSHGSGSSPWVSSLPSTSPEAGVH